MTLETLFLITGILAFCLYLFKTIAEALIAICDHECCMYGMEDAVKLAEKYTEDV